MSVVELLQTYREVHEYREEVYEWVLASFALFAVCRSLSCYRLTAERTKNAKKSLSDTSARFTICRSLSLLKTYREVHEDREELYEWGLSELRALCGI